MIAPLLVIILKSIGARISDLGAWLVTLGALGMFGISLLDSAFIPLPSGPDAVMALLTALRPAWMPVYALAATAGSVLGSVLLYAMARRAGARALESVKPQSRQTVERLLGRYDMLALIAAAVMPPPFPFKVFVLSAGVFKLKLSRFAMAILIGRAARFLIEGWLALKFGEDAYNIIRRQGLKVVIGVGVVLLAFLLFRFYRLRTRQAMPLAVDEIKASREDL